MHLPISSWRETLARLGLKVRKHPRKSAYRSPRRLLVEPLESRELLTTITVALGQNATEGSQTGYFTFTRDSTVGNLTVWYSVDQTASTASTSDYTSPSSSGSVTFSAGSSTVSLNVVPVDDSLVESTESVAVKIQSGMSSASYSIGTPSSASCLIYDNDVSATVNVAATQNAAEGGQNGVFTFTRDVTTGSLTVWYSIDQTASTATYNSDYTSPSTSGSVTFSAGSSSVTLNVVPSDDSLVENTESVVLKLQSASGSGQSYTIGASSSASVSITDNDVAATINVAATQNAIEGSQTGYFTFTRDVTTGSLTVWYSIDGASTATPSSDYTGPSSSGSVTFSAGSSSVTLNVVPVDDTLVENNESVILHLQSAMSSGQTYTIGSASSATVLVVDNDVAAVVNVAATQNAAEPDQTGYFTFTRDVTTGSLTVSYSIDSASTATLNSDYTGPSMSSGSVTFAAGSSSVTLNVVPVDDTLVESDESVILHLQSASMSGQSYTIGSASSATVLVISDDVPATINVAATQNAAEPNQTGYFTFTRDITAGALTVNYVIDQTASTAMLGTDYTGPSSSGSVSFAAGASSVTLNVAPVDDSFVDPNETVVLKLASPSMSTSSYNLGSASSASLLVVDDDVTSVVNVAATQNAAEGSQTGYFTFTRDTTSGTTIVFYTIDPVASTASSSDYTGPSMSGSVTFSSGSSSVTLNVAPVDDSLIEPTESVVLRLQSASMSGSSYTVGTASRAVLLITDNDVRATVNVSVGQDAAEPDEAGHFTFTRDTTSGNLAVYYVIDQQASTATYGADYTGIGTSGVLTIPDGSTSATLDVVPIEDTLIESDESVVLVLQAGMGYTIGTSSQAAMTIEDAVIPITVSVGDSAVLDEGQTFARAGSFSDAATTTWTATVDYGDGGGSQTLTLNTDKTFSLSHLYANDGEYTVTVTVTAADARTATSTLDVQVGNVTPAVDVGADTTIEPGTTFTRSGSFVDPGTGSWTATVNYGEGAGPQTLSLNADKSFALSHAYSTSGTYTVTVAVTDDASTTGTDTLTVTVDAFTALDLDGDNSSGASGTGYTGLFTEGGGPVPVADSDAALSDADNANLASLTATITNLLDGSDEVLSVDTTNTSIQASYSGGVLTLSGADTVAHYQQVLRTIHYTNNAEAPHTTTRSIEVAASDGIVSTTATATIALQMVNDAPVAESQSVTTAEDTPLAIALGEDGDGEVVQTLTLTVVTAPSHGTLSGFNSSTGEVTYTPIANYHGPDSFSYTLTDDATAGGSALTSDEATVTITVTAVNDAPIADAQSVGTSEDTAASITLTGSDGDPEVAQTLTFELASPPSHGTLSGFNASTGAVTYTPNAGYAGSDSFSFLVIDDATAGGAAMTSAAATVSITVSAVNQAPVVDSQEATTAEDAPLALSLGSDGDGEVTQTLTLNVVTAPSHGTLGGFNSSTGGVTYTPNANYHGSDSFTYTLTDDNTAGGDALTSAQATVTITVTAVNDPPVADAQNPTTTEDTAAALTLTGSDSDPEVVQTLVFAIATSPSHGTLTGLNSATGEVTYTPDAGYAGPDSFTFTVTDDATAGGTAETSAAATVSITVTAVNDAPIAQTQSVTATEDIPLSIALGSDSDAEVVQTLTMNVVSGPSHGALSGFNSSTGTVTYTPDANYHGSDSFTFTLTDDNTAGGDALTSAQATVTITVAAVNDAPIADAQSTSTAEDTALSVQLSGSDGDPEVTQALTFAIATPPSHGTLSGLNSATGEVTYTPNADYVGADSFTFTVTDDTSAGGAALTSAAATVSLTVTAVNDAPVANDGQATVEHDTAKAIALTGSDGDPEVAQVLTFAITSQPSHGTLSGFNSATGAVTYTPDTGYEGEDSFTFTVTDDATAGAVAELTSAAGTVTLTVLGPNHLPVAVDDAYSTNEDRVLVVAPANGLKANDTEPDGDATYLSVVSQPEHGVVSIADDGRFIYVPEANFFGTDSFTYMSDDRRDGTDTAVVTITVNAVNDRPLAISDIYRSHEATMTVSADDGVLVNDTDVEDDPLTVALVTGPAHGTLNLASDGSFTYTRQTGYLGSDSFRYKANDGQADSNVVTVHIVVDELDAAPVAVNDAYTTAEDTELVVFGTSGVLANDSDADEEAFAAVLVTEPEHGTVKLFSGGAIRYLPDPNFAGTDSFTYRATDGKADSAPATVTITVTPVNDVPVAVDDTAATDEDTPVNIDVLANDSDVEESPLEILILDATHGTAVVNDGGTPADFTDDTVDFTPAADFHGEAQFTYQASDGDADSNVVTVRITVSPVYDAPVAVADAAETGEDTAVNVDVLANDANADGSPLSITIVSATHGTATVNNGGTPGDWTDDTVDFTPDAEYYGTAEFTYKLNDGTSDSNTATVTVTVISDNLVPVAADDTAWAYNTTPVNIDILANDTDGDSQPLTITVVGATHGTTAVDQNGTPADPTDDTITFTPESGYHGVATVQYKVSDGESDSNIATVTITVHPANGAAVALVDSAATNEDTAVNVDVLANDFDPQSDPLTITITSATHGTAVVNNGGTPSDPSDDTVDFTPEANFSGTAEFTYKANDGTADSNVATVTITVAAVNDAPVAVADSGATNPFATLQLTPLANDSDVDDTELEVLSIDTTGTQGLVTDMGDGVLVYDPNGHFRSLAIGQSATDTFHYTVSDGHGGTAVGTVTVTLTGLAPEMEVRLVDDTLVEHGVTTVEFGTALIGSPVTMTFVVHNAGYGALVLNPSSLYVPAGFVIASALPGSILPGEDGQFKLRLQAAAVGSYSGQVSFTSNDPEASPFSFTVSGTVENATGYATIDNLHLVHDTGYSQTDLVTKDARIAGQLIGPHVATTGVQADLNGDGWGDPSDGTVTIGDNGQFIYTPPTTSPPLALGQHTIRFRTVVSGMPMYFGPWIDFTFTLVGPNTAPVVSTLDLANPESGTPLRTYDPTVTGTVTNDGPVGQLRIEFDVDANGTVDQSAETDANGHFNFSLSGLKTGENTVKARAVEWDYDAAAEVAGAWKSLTFIYNGADGPTIDNFRLQNDTGTSATDLVTSDPTVAGEVSAGDMLYGLTVEFDVDGDGMADGTTLTDDDGHFSYLPTGLEPGEITIKARAYSVLDTQGNSVQGAWTELTFTLEAAPAPIISDLRLVHDTGESDTDKVTSDPQIAGQVTIDGAPASIMIEFDANGDDQRDGYVLSDLEGNFSFTPTGLADGPVSVQIRSAVLNNQTAEYTYGDWISFEFTLNSGSQITYSGSTSPPQVASVTEGYETALAETLWKVDDAFELDPGSAKTLGCLQIGRFTALDAPGQGFAVASPAAVPVSQTYSNTVTVDKTVSTTTGQWTVASTADVDYEMTVTGDASSGTFVLHVTIDAQMDYAESGEVGSGEASAATSAGGDYHLVFDAEGTYSVVGGVVILTGTYTATESGGPDGAAAGYGTATTTGPAGWSAAQTSGSAGTGQVVTGSFSPSGVTSTYLISNSNHWENHQSDTSTTTGGPYSYAATSTNTTGTTTNTYTTYHDTVSDYVYIESGTNTPAGNVGTYYYYSSWSDSAGWGYTSGWNLTYNNPSYYGASVNSTNNGSASMSVGGSVWYSVTDSGSFSPSSRSGNFVVNDGSSYYYTYNGWGNTTYTAQDASGTFQNPGGWTASSSDNALATGNKWGSYTVTYVSNAMPNVTSSGGYLFTYHGHSETHPSNWASYTWTANASSTNPAAWGDWSQWSNWVADLTSVDSGSFDNTGSTGGYFVFQTINSDWGYTWNANVDYNQTSGSPTREEYYYLISGGNGLDSYTYLVVAGYTPTSIGGLYSIVRDGHGGSNYYIESTVDTTYQLNGWDIQTNVQAHAWGDDSSNWWYREGGIIQTGGNQGGYFSHIGQHRARALRFHAGQHDHADQRRRLLDHALRLLGHLRRKRLQLVQRRGRL